VRALVTGGHGFVGRWLTAHLEKEGDEVVATGEEVDVTDPAAVRRSFDEIRPDAVYHLAGWAHVGSSWDDPAGAFLVNANGTVHVLDAARRLESPPRVLVVSSAEVYGVVTADKLPLREQLATDPVSPYAASKVAAEVAARQAASGYGLHVTVVRPFNHIGPGQSPQVVVSALAKRIVEAERSGVRVLEMGNPTPSRDLTDVRDVVRAYRLLAERGEPGAVYNVCTGHDVAIQDLADQLLQMADRPLRLETDPDLLRPVDLPVLRGDPSRLQAATGWQPEVPIERTLADLLDDLRARVQAEAPNPMESA
jgi:GDP-4-dehydro-6-deoxy-D-mannose reductase